ncbi:uncharacterized protein LOC100882320 [Megachile rotundata]|uniref:uncharacterized protein LOC100882320 n=1 Tax=Megachile rotundata TaxID=143995 RepID=UPI003FD5280B
MDRFLHFVLLFAVLHFAMQETVEEGGCECGVFEADTSKSIIERALKFNVTCNSKGEEECQLLCVALAQSAKDKAPQMICEILNATVENLQVAVYSKVCNEANWKFTGLKSGDPICCHEGKPKSCYESSSIINDWMNSFAAVNP